MRGEQFAKVIEQLLAERGITKGEFYKAIGISATALYGWKRGAEPKRETIEAVEKYFNVDLNAIGKETDMDEETAEILQRIKDDYAYKALYRSTKDLTTADVYAAVSLIEKMKAGET